jgi:hypothetical protein
MHTVEQTSNARDVRSSIAATINNRTDVFSAQRSMMIASCFVRYQGSNGALSSDVYTLRQNHHRVFQVQIVRTVMRLAPALLVIVGAACADAPINDCCLDQMLGVRVINAFTGPVDVLIDGNVAASALAAGAIDTLRESLGTHTLTLRPSTGASASQSVTTALGALNTIAAVRLSNGSVSAVALDDTNSIVPDGATKVRVLHLAPNAGELQVYRTQPDYQQPTSWQFPFTYQERPTSLSAPFYQSTVGTWEVRIWQTPPGASGWATAPVKIVLPLGSREKRTILMLDKAGGGVRVEIL